MTHNVPRFDGDVAGAFVLRLAVALQSAGARVDVLAPGAPGLEPTSVLEGVRIQRVRYASETRMTLAYTGTMAEAVQGSWGGRVALLQLLRHLRTATRRTLDAARAAGDPYTVVHAHWWFPAALALWRALEGTPLVITMHGSDVRLAEKVRAAHPLMRTVLRQARACTAVSSWLADTSHRIAPMVPVTVAPMPVDDRLLDAPAHAPADALWGESADHSVADGAARRRILFVGRLNAQKGIADLLDALADPRLAEATLTVVGDGPDAGALREQAVRLGIATRITWTGVLPPRALPDVYRSAAVVAMPSRNEGFGLVAVEAQLCGVPVVAYAEGGLLDAVRPEHGGSLVTPGDSRALAEAIHRLLADPVARTAASTRAREFARAHFTPEAVAACYLDIYRSIR